MWEKGEELELQIILQEVQSTRGVREGNVGGQLARAVLRCIGKQVHREQQIIGVGDAGAQLAGNAADS